MGDVGLHKHVGYCEKEDKKVLRHFLDKEEKNLYSFILFLLYNVKIIRQFDNSGSNEAILLFNQTQLCFI